MKTNPAARRMLKAQFIALCVAVAAMAGLGLTLGRASAERVAQTTASQDQGRQAPIVALGDMFAGTR